VRKVFLVAALTAATFAMLAWSRHEFGARSAWFAFLVVWLPMTLLGILSHFMRLRLPDGFHVLRRVERDGRLYEMLGVRVFKRLLRRGPLAVFNPDLHLPADPSTTNLAHLDQRMRDAEASHFILLVSMLGVVVHAAVRGWWGAAGWTLLFDVLVNGYPVMLQRYNRGLLSRRFNPSRTTERRADNTRARELRAEALGLRRAPGHRRRAAVDGAGSGEPLRSGPDDELDGCRIAQCQPHRDLVAHHTADDRAGQQQRQGHCGTARVPQATSSGRP
jgi:Glycosyl-4,4'-diaponeurosporenoate acyltransferase